MHGGAGFLAGIFFIIMAIQVILIIGMAIDKLFLQ